MHDFNLHNSIYTIQVVPAVLFYVEHTNSAAVPLHDPTFTQSKPWRSSRLSPPPTASANALPRGRPAVVLGDGIAAEGKCDVSLAAGDGEQSLSGEEAQPRTDVDAPSSCHR